MPSATEILSGLLGDVRDRMSGERERQNTLDETRTKYQLQMYGDMLKDPNFDPSMAPAVIGDMSELISGLGKPQTGGLLGLLGNAISKGKPTGAAKDVEAKKQRAQAMLTELFSRVRQESTPPIPGQELQLPPVPGGEIGSGEPGAPPRVSAAPVTPPAAVSKMTLPEVPGLPERRGPFLTQEEMEQRNIRQSGEKVEVEETARRRAAAPFVKQAAEIEHQNRLTEIRAQQEGRIIRGAPTPDPRPEAMPWDYVTPIYHGDGTTVFEAARRPAAIESAYQTAQAVAGRDRIPLTQAWDEVWRQGFETKEQQAQARAGAEVERTGRIERGNLQRQRLQQLLSRSSRGPQAGGLRPSEARAALGQISSEVRARKAACDPDDPLTDMSFEEAMMEVAREWGLTTADVTRLRNISAGIVAAPAAAPPRGSAAPTWERYRQRRAPQGR